MKTLLAARLLVSLPHGRVASFFPGSQTPPLARHKSALISAPGPGRVWTVQEQTGGARHMPQASDPGDDARKPQDGIDAQDPVTAIRNIGPAQAAQMARAGIPSATALRKMGADAAYRAMLRTGTEPHFIAYYVLHMALQGRPWNDCKGAEKAALRARFDAIKAEVGGGRGDAALERILDQIGTGLRR